MTKSHHDHAPSSGEGQPVIDAERVAAELAALGEDPADDEELAVLATSGAEAPDVRTVATLVELSTWRPPAGGLLPLERHRVWRRIAQRGSAPLEPSEELAANDGLPARAAWRGGVAGLALVATVALLPRFYDPAPAPSEEQRAATRSVGEAARQALETLPGPTDGPRVRSLAEGYAARLRGGR